MFDRVLQSQPINLSFAALKVVSLLADVVFLHARRMLHFRMANDTLED